VYVGSLFVIMGRQKGSLLVVGMALICVALGVAVYLAVERRPGLPRPPLAMAAIGGVAVFYLVCGIAAAFVGPGEAAATLAAGAVPMTAAAVTVALMRRKSRAEDGRIRDVSVEDQSPFPGIGMDDETPVGASPEVHADIDPHDIPPGHPARRALESERGDTAADGAGRGNAAGGPPVDDVAADASGQRRASTDRDREPGDRTERGERTDRGKRTDRSERRAERPGAGARDRR
jgi:hypothetical protein